MSEYEDQNLDIGTVVGTVIVAIVVVSILAGAAIFGAAVCNDRWSEWCVEEGYAEWSPTEEGKLIWEDVEQEQDNE